MILELSVVVVGILVESSSGRVRMIRSRDEGAKQHNKHTERQSLLAASPFLDQYLIAGAHIVLIAVDVHPLGNVWRLLLDRDQQIKRAPIEA